MNPTFDDLNKLVKEIELRARFADPFDRPVAGQIFKGVISHLDQSYEQVVAADEECGGVAGIIEFEIEFRGFDPRTDRFIWHYNGPVDLVRSRRDFHAQN